MHDSRFPALRPLRSWLMVLRHSIARARAGYGLRDANYPCCRLPCSTGRLPGDSACGAPSVLIVRGLGGCSRRIAARVACHDWGATSFGSCACSQEPCQRTCCATCMRAGVCVCAAQVPLLLRLSLRWSAYGLNVAGLASLLRVVFWRIVPGRSGILMGISPVAAPGCHQPWG